MSTTNRINDLKTSIYLADSAAAKEWREAGYLSPYALAQQRRAQELRDELASYERSVLE